MALREAASFCRICNGGCATLLQIDEQDRIVGVRGNKASTLTKGYACFKGLQAAESHHGPARLLHPLVRDADGALQQTTSEQALDEIAGKLSAIIAEHGPQAVAVYCGNGALFNISAYFMHRSFLAAIGSDQYFSTLTIDQSAKTVAFGRLGGWDAGFPAFEDMEVALLFGANPLVSHGSLNFLSVDPVKRLKAARARGLKLIVVDPRITETARNADLVLQPYPGQDPAIIGALIRMILDEGWEDAAFCTDYVGAMRMADLRRAVEPFTPDYVEHRAGLAPGQIRAVAELFARDSRTGCATLSTGPCMAPFSNLSAHLTEVLNVICGRYLRAGERRHTISAVAPLTPRHAEVIPPARGWEAGGASRVRGAHSLYGERPTGTLTDEILTPGPGKIRALIVDGGDPLTAFPDQVKTAAALRDLDLLVSIEPWTTPTTEHAHYILPPVMQYERADLPMTLDGYVCWPGTWYQYTPAVIPPPAGSDVVEDWYVFWAIAKRLGKAIVYNGTTPLDPEAVPQCDDLLGAVVADGLISLDELKAHPAGIDIAVPDQFVQPARAGQDACFDPMPEDVAAELAQFLDHGTVPPDVLDGPDGFTHLLTTRRMRDLFNSNGRHLRTVRQRTPYNPAFLHPDELARLGIAEGDRVEITSAHGRVVAIAGADETVRPGVLSIAHGWGAAPGSALDPAETGTAVNALIDTDRNFEPINAMPHMSAVPVRITRLAG